MCHHLEELLGAIKFKNAASIQNEDAIRIHDRVQAMCYCQGCAISKSRANGLLSQQ